MPVSQISQFAIGKLNPHPANVHTHSKKQIGQIARNIQQFGFIDPIIADEDSSILAGHGRWHAAKQLGLEHVPVVVVSGLSEAERRAYILSDNRLTEKAGWDRPALAAELQLLTPLLSDAGLDIELTGFESPEIDALMGELVDAEQDPADEVPEIVKEPVSHRGDLWLLDNLHFLYCGDAKNEADLRNLMGRERAAMVFTDPPFNVRISSVQGRGKIHHREFLEGSGELSPEAFTRFLADSLSLAAKHSVDGSIHYVCMDWRHISEMLPPAKRFMASQKILSSGPRPTPVKAASIAHSTN
jgi:ParB-like chromosome segregation protein Spo0J